MTAREWYEKFDKMFPPSLSCPWDNDGVMLCLDWDRPIRKILTCLDVTLACVKKAAEEGYDLIVSHHPFLFRPLKRIDGDSLQGEKIKLLIRANVAVFSFHTRMDNAPGGLNDRLASVLGLEEIQSLCMDDPTEMAKAGRIDSCPPRDFAAAVASRLASPVILHEGNRPVRRVMSVCGGGKDFIPLALRSGADAFVSGDLSYNAVLDAVQEGLTVVDAGHRATEIMACGLFREKILAEDPTVRVTEYPFGGEECHISP